MFDRSVKNYAICRWACGGTVAFALSALLTFAAPVPASAQATKWDRIANIKASAVALSNLQQAKGALGAFEFIANCYKTHELASTYGASLEGCLVMDYLHSKVTAAVYANVEPANRNKMGLPEPDELVGTMLKRVGGAMAAYKVTEADARKFVGDIETHGMPAFAKARFPKAAE
jgi:hypothetical protein